MWDLPTKRSSRSQGTDTIGTGRGSKERSECSAKAWPAGGGTDFFTAQRACQ